jgi:hypothetical protein
MTSAVMGAVALATVFKSGFIPLALTGIRQFVPNYADPQCLLRLVNETANDHYTQHVYFQNVAYDDTCEGGKLHDYVNSQYNELGQFEKKLFLNTFMTTGALGAAYLLYDFSKKPSLRYLAKLAFNQITLYNTNIVAAFLSLTHFEQDITFMLGNIMHHSDVSRFTENSNASFVDSLPNGFLLNSFCNVIWTVYFLYLLTPFMKRFGQSESSASTIVAQTFVGLTVLLWKIADQHPKFHELANESFKDAWPFTFEYQAYKHVIVHHGNGDAFASNILLDPIFSAALYGYDFIHNTLLGLTIGSHEETALAIAYDVVLSFVIVALSITLITVQGSLFNLLWADSTPAAQKQKSA